jgi:hypothetical protein
MRSAFVSRIAVSHFNRRRHKIQSYHRFLGITPRPIIPQPGSMVAPRTRSYRRQKRREERLARLGPAMDNTGGHLTTDGSATVEGAIETDGAPSEGNS